MSRHGMVMRSTLSMQRDIIDHHYTHSLPSGACWYFDVLGVVVVFSIPANRNIARFLGCTEVWELSRLWAADGHGRNLLTQALKQAISAFRLIIPGADALVSYADPNVGHEGYVYRAASWIYLGRSKETRAYVGRDGTVKPRRAFHSGSAAMTKAEIAATGWKQINLLGKHRYAKGLTKKARRSISGIMQAEAA